MKIPYRRGTWESTKIRVPFDFPRTWLDRHARELPGYSEILLQRQARLLLASLRDLTHSTGLEHELASMSEELASTYEELTLIYQVSGGMKINRRASDFFKQTCLEVLQVMGMRGVGVALQADSHAHFEPVLYGQVGLAPQTLKRLGNELTEFIRCDAETLLINDLGTCNPARPCF